MSEVDVYQLERDLREATAAAVSFEIRVGEAVDAVSRTEAKIAKLADHLGQAEAAKETAESELAALRGDLEQAELQRDELLDVLAGLPEDVRATIEAQVHTWVYTGPETRAGVV